MSMSNMYHSDDLNPSPLEDAGFLSKIFFSWLLDILKLGSKRNLDFSDLYRVPPTYKSEKLGDDLEQAWTEQIRAAERWNLLHKNKQPKRPSLRKAIVKVFFWQYAVLGLVAFIEECIIRIAQPILLGFIIQYCVGESDYGDVAGYLFGVTLFILSAMYTATHQPYVYLILLVGMKIRVACSSLIYRKTLKLTQEAIGKTNVGQLVNLLSNDVNRFDESGIYLHYLWVGPIQLVIVTFILWHYFDWSCLVGVFVLVLFVPFQVLMGKLYGVLRLQIVERTDRRVRIMSEIITAVRTIKMCAWELPFAKMIVEARKKEVKCIRKTSILKAINLSFFDISAKVIVFLTILTYVLEENQLSAEQVFVVLVMYNNVKLIMTLCFPLAISQLNETLVSIKRLENFLVMEERAVSPELLFAPIKATRERLSPKQNEQGEITMTDINARWSGSTNSDVNANTLSNISLQVTAGQLVAVIGSVGSGKSSLLQVLLHELPYSSGSFQVKGRVAYVCQQPWIFSGSIRDNILFGREYEYYRYHHVIQVCALSQDMELFPYQDQTLVGDRGTSLSGGQKARINLARAVYADADVYLLDDPFSAVDAEVAKHIFVNCIMGLLKEKAKLLVTHQLQFLKSADEIILLKKGIIEARGNYTELFKSGVNFTKALKDEENTSAKFFCNKRDRPSNFLEVKVMDGLRNSKTFQNRRFSMSYLEFRTSESLVVQEPLEPEDDPVIIKRNTCSSNRNTYGTFSQGSCSDALGETCPLIPPKPQVETRSGGRVALRLCWSYICAGVRWFTILLLFLSAIIVQVLFSGSDYWLQRWARKEERKRKWDMLQLQQVNNSNAKPAVTTIPADYSEINDDEEIEVYVYCALVGGLFIMSLIRNLAFFNVCLQSSIQLHRRLFHGVMKAAMSFFEINPSSRVLARFGRDVAILDEVLPMLLFDSVQVALHVIGVVTIITINNQYLIIPSLLLPFVFFFVRKFYLKTAKSIKFLESSARAPVFSHVITSLNGLSTIHAMKVEDQFEMKYDELQDLHTASWVVFLATAKWLAIVVDWCCVVYIGIVIFTVLLMKDEMTPPSIGLSIACAMSLAGMFQWGVRQSAEAANQAVSVRRIQDYAEIEPEGAFHSSPSNKPPSTWPSKGEIEFKNVALKYGDNKPVLRYINRIIKSREKVGIVGRTGSGKSSLITALFRITNPSQGDIAIDGISILGLGLHDLRRKISTIPQDPILFNCTLRWNLDPFGEYSDEELWAVLEQVHLARIVRESPAGLETEIAESGSNLSVGQRQLICLGRAILRKNKILVLDEATSNVDHETEHLIQETIREKFGSCTVLTIAHRLQTVMDCDRILVLDAGKVKEFDEPYNLLCNGQSALSNLVKTTGKSTAAELNNLAKKAHENRKQELENSGAKLSKKESTQSSRDRANSSMF